MLETFSSAPKREKVESGKPVEAAYLRAMRVSDVVLGSPAEKAGLLPGDEVIEVDGQPVTSIDDYFTHATERKEQPMTMTLLRGGERRDIVVTQTFDEVSQRYRVGILFHPEQIPNEKIEIVQVGEQVFERHHGRMLVRDGSVLCDYHYDLEMEAKKRGTATKGIDRYDATKDEKVRRMRSFVLRHQGTQAEIDLFAVFNAEQTPVYMKNGRLPDAEGFHDPTRGEVVLGRLAGTAIDVHVLLHELRHARQTGDPRFVSVLPFYGIEGQFMEKGRWSPPAGSWQAEAWQNEGDDFLESMRDLCRAFKPLGLEYSAETLGEKILPLTDRLQELHRIGYDDEHPESLSEEEARKAEMEQIKHDILQTEMSPGVSVHDLLMLPRRVIERDAEFGALMSERRVRKETGINLFGEIYDTYKEDMRQAIRGQGEKFLEAQRATLTAEEQADFDERIKVLETDDHETTKVVTAVRNYMNSIGATPKMIRAYYEGGERKEA